MPDLVLQRAEANAPRRDTTAVAVPPLSSAAVTGNAGSGGKGKIEMEGCAQPALGGKATSSSDTDDTNKGKDHAGQCVLLKTSIAG